MHPVQEKTAMDGTRYIVAGSFIDGSGGAMRRHIYLAVRDTVITGVGPAGELPRDAGIAAEDFSHCTIVPALADCSASLASSPSVGDGFRLQEGMPGPAATFAMVDRHVRYCHAHGVLGVADTDNHAGLVARYREERKQGIIDIRTSGPTCRNPRDCTDGDFLRVGHTGSIEEKNFSPRFNREDLHRILQSRDGKKAIVTANGRQAVAEALAAGCDAIEQGYEMGAENLREMAARNVLWIPCVLRAGNALANAGAGGDAGCRFSQRYAVPGKPDPGAEAFWKKMLARQIEQLGLARQLGVRTAVGTGAGSAGILHGESLVEEMKMFIKAGYSLVETLRCASDTGARFFGLKKPGILAIGRKATFLLTRGTPQQLPRKLGYLEGIYVDGLPSVEYSKNPVRTG